MTETTTVRKVGPENDDDRWVIEGVAAARGMLDVHGPEIWQISTLAGTGGGAFGGSVVLRFESPTRTAIAKLVRRNDLAPDHPWWWRRELDVYRSEWLGDRMPVGLSLPDCLGSMTTDDAAVIVLSDLPFDRESRTAAWYGDLAILLGQLNGPSADPAATPPWATRRFVAHETDEAVSLIPDAVANRSLVIADVIDLWGPLLERIALAGTQLVEVLSSFPVGLHHLDAFSRNATRVGERFVLIDWAYTGLAPLGCDAASVIVVTGLHGDVPGARLGEFHEAVINGYTAGLRSVGVELPTDHVRLAIDVALTLRFARSLTQMHGAGDSIVSIIAGAIGRPFTDLMVAWMSLARHLAPSAKRALASVGG